MLLLFKKKRRNGINKCPILGIDIYSGVELFNAIYFFFRGIIISMYASKQASMASLRRWAEENTFCACCMGAMITFMRIMAKYGCEKWEMVSKTALCAYWRELALSEGVFRSTPSIYLHSSARSKAKHKNMCINL